MAKRRAYLHQFDDLGEHNVHEIAETLKLGGLSEVCVKSSQDRNFIAPKYDHSPMGISSLSTLRQRRDEFAAEGITMTAWHVLDGSDPVGEAKFLRGIANILDAVELDLEPFPGFFEGKDLAASIDQIVKLNIIFDVDADFRVSSGGFADFGPGKMQYALAHARAVYGQSYWTDFERTPEAVITEFVHNVTITLDYNGPLGMIFPWDGYADYQSAWTLCQSYNLDDLSMYLMGLAGPKTYHALAAIPTTAPTDPLVIVKNSLDTLWRIAAALRSPLDHATQARQIEQEVVVIKDTLKITS